MKIQSLLLIIVFLLPLLVWGAPPQDEDAVCRTVGEKVLGFFSLGGKSTSGSSEKEKLQKEAQALHAEADKLRQQSEKARKGFFADPQKSDALQERARQMRQAALAKERDVIRLGITRTTSGQVVFASDYQLLTPKAVDFMENMGPGVVSRNADGDLVINLQKIPWRYRDRFMQLDFAHEDDVYHLLGEVYMTERNPAFFNAFDRHFVPTSKSDGKISRDLYRREEEGVSVSNDTPDQDQVVEGEMVVNGKKAFDVDRYFYYVYKRTPQGTRINRGSNCGGCHTERPSSHSYESFGLHPGFDFEVPDLADPDQFLINTLGNP